MLNSLLHPQLSQATLEGNEASTAFIQQFLEDAASGPLDQILIGLYLGWETTKKMARKICMRITAMTCQEVRS